MAHYEKMLKGTTLYDGKIIKLHLDDVELEDATVAKREFVTHSGGATVVAETEEGILFVEQFRYPYGEVVLELPAGKREKCEDPEITARRELEEETGYFAQKLTFLGVIYPTPGYSNEKIFMYLAEGLERREQRPDEDEFLSVRTIKPEVVAQMVASGEIKDAKTQIALLKYFCFFRGRRDATAVDKDAEVERE